MKSNDDDGRAGPKDKKAKLNEEDEDNFLLSYETDGTKFCEYKFQNKVIKSSINKFIH